MSGNDVRRSWDRHKKNQSILHDVSVPLPVKEKETSFSTPRYYESKTTVETTIPPVYRASSVDPLRPSDGEPKVGFEGKVLPKVIFERNCYMQLMDWARCFPDVEVSVFGKIEREKWVFKITELYFPSQACGGATTEPELSDLHKWLKEQGREKELADNDKWLFWGHFHPGSSASPSGQDEDQMKMFDVAPYFVRGIFARSGGEAQFFVQDNTGFAKVTVNRIGWTYEEPSGRDPKDIEKEVEEKVRRIGGSYSYSRTQYGWPGRENDYRGSYNFEGGVGFAGGVKTTWPREKAAKEADQMLDQTYEGYD